jgi:hypothetical protein
MIENESPSTQQGRRGFGYCYRLIAKIKPDVKNKDLTPSPKVFSLSFPKYTGKIRYCLPGASPPASLPSGQEKKVDLGINF